MKAMLNLKSRWRRKLAWGALAGGLMGLEAQAQPVLIYVNTTAPSAVTFTATTEKPQANDSTDTTGEGIWLMNFFQDGDKSSYGGSLAESDLLANDAKNYYGSWYVPGDTAADNMHLQLYYSGGTDAQNFTTSSTAFSGKAAADISDPALLNSVLAYGKTGDGWGEIRSGSRTGTIIGYWAKEGVVVPEPQTWATLMLLVGGLTGIGLRRRLQSRPV